MRKFANWWFGVSRLLPVFPRGMWIVTGLILSGMFLPEYYSIGGLCICALVTVLASLPRFRPEG